MSKDAPERLWLAVDRKGKICGSPDAHVEPCDEVKSAYHEYVLARAAPTVKPLEWRNCKGGEKAETIFGDVVLSFDGHTLDSDWQQDIQADMPWGECEVFTNMDDAEAWIMSKLLARILSALK